MDQAKRQLSVPAIGMILMLIAGSCAPGGSGAPELVLTGAKVYTMSWADPDGEGVPAPDAPFRDGRWHPDAQAVAIRAGRIVFVGSTAQALELTGPDTRTLDLAGATVIPGAVESHGHVHELGEHHEDLDLTNLPTAESMVDLVAERAADIPADEWIVGWGWDEGEWADRLPVWTGLNERIPDNPVVLKGRRGFAAWGNRAALDAAGLTADAQNPEGGEIVRNASGARTGVVLNNALDVLYDAIPERTLEQKKRILRFGLEELAASGYVAAHHAGVRFDYMPAYEALRSDGALPLRVFVMLAAVADNADLLEARMAQGPTADPDDRLQVRGVKAYYDGSLGSRGARMLEPYSDRPGHTGVSGDEYGFDESVVEAMMKAGFQVGIHAIGDAANRHVLDFYARVFERNPALRSLGHRVEHAQIVHPADFSRFADLNLVASMEPGHAVEDSPWAEDRVGPERILGAYAWRTFRRHGVPLLLNSDYSGTDHSLFYGLYCAVTRRDRSGSPPEGWYADQQLTPEEALRGYTVWPAAASGWAEGTGTIEVGKWADLTVLSADPLNVAPADAATLLEGHVVLTIVAGEVVFESQGK